MSFGLGKAAAGLPALLGVLLGIRSFTGGVWWVALCVGMVVVPYLAMQLGQGMLHVRPRLGRWLIELWIVAAVGVMALATAFVIHVGLSPLPDWLGFGASDEATKAVSAAFAGAVSTYVALLWTKDIGDATGYFWPSSQFKAGMGKAYEAMKKKPLSASPEYEAMFEDVVEGRGAIGWGSKARGIRADIVAKFLGQS